MQVELQNFLSVLSTGAFDTPLDVQPMSRFKWQRLMLFAEQEKVKEFVVYGIQRSVYGEDVLPKEQRKTLEEMYDYKRRLYHSFKNNAKPVTRFSNRLLRRKLSKVFHDEIHKYDAQLPKLALIDMICHFLKEAFTGRLSFVTIVKIGLYLRQEGDRVDLNGVDEAIATLRLTKTANLIGTLLVKVFGFSRDEVQFLKDFDDSYEEVVQHYFDMSLHDMSSRRHREMAGSQRAVGSHDRSRQSAKRGWYYARYHRAEAISSYASNLLRSVTQIEE